MEILKQDTTNFIMMVIFYSLILHFLADYDIITILYWKMRPHFRLGIYVYLIPLQHIANYMSVYM